MVADRARAGTARPAWNTGAVQHFSPDVVTAVLEHMNNDHAQDSLVIVRAFARRDAESARMTGLDGSGGEWDASVRGEIVPVRIPWPNPVTERPQIRRAVVDLYHRGCAELGVTPHEPH